ncbi:MAG: isoprenylcysteine carboxylmethyltransferase family protein [Pseudomonadota bacterium]
MSTKRRILPPTLLGICMLAALLLHIWLPLAWILWPVVRLLGALLLLFGLYMTASAAGEFNRAGTPVLPFERSTVLVTAGWFRYTRNPMYLGMALMLFGGGMALGSLGALLPTAAFVATVQSNFIEGEEELLTETFGEHYREYKSRVRRWL